MADVPLIDPPAQLLTLADGRRLSWREFGLPDGEPVLYFHGGGSTSLEAGIFHREAVQRGLRLIATDRPGAGGSSLRPGRPVAAYSDDLTELLDALGVDRFACFGESNGGMVTLAVAATLPARVLGAVPINPTVPWFDPVARRVSSRSAAVAYRLLTYAPRLLAVVDGYAAHRTPGVRPALPPRSEVGPSDLIGPPPGIEPDVGEFHLRAMGERAGSAALLAELRWAGADWGFDHYSVSVPLDVFCGAYDLQAPFALVLADRNDARFHSFSFGHVGFSHPDARRRIVDVVAGYLESRRNS